MSVCVPRKDYEMLALALISFAVSLPQLSIFVSYPHGQFIHGILANPRKKRFVGRDSTLFHSCSAKASEKDSEVRNPKPPQGARKTRVNTVSQGLGVFCV